jgi:hypothetical protein
VVPSRIISVYAIIVFIIEAMKLKGDQTRPHHTRINKTTANDVTAQCTHRRDDGTGNFSSKNLTIRNLLRGLDMNQRLRVI